MNISRLSIVYICSAMATFSFTACQDDWDEHYDSRPKFEGGDATLYESIAARPELSDFKEVLDSVRVFANHRLTDLYYSDVLGSDQFYSVWAPVNGTFNKDSLLRLCATVGGDSIVERHFLRNHIARYRYSSVPEKQSFQMLNTKTLAMEDGEINHVGIKEQNIPTKNGILHVIEAPVSYYYNIYEGLFSIEKYSHLGSYLRSYQTEEFDEVNSLAMGVVDGKTVYVDSVFINKNTLLNVFGYIDNEDSTYWMIVPTRTLWDSLYAEAESYYNYGAINKADSIHNYWSHYALLQDLVYNPHVQPSVQDSVVSTAYCRWDPKYHVYYKPFEAGGLFSAFADSMRCSNGCIYEIDHWPFVKEKTFFIPIKTEGEGRIYEDYETATKKLTLERRFVSADSVSGGYISITPQTTYDAYYVTYEISSVLSGKYDVCVVMLPKTVYNPDYSPEKDKKQFRPNKFTAEIYYAGTDGKEYSLSTTAKYVIDETSPSYYVKSSSSDADFIFDCNFDATKTATRAFTNDPYVVDTIKLATVKFPTCNYAQQKTTTRIKIINNIRSNQTNAYNGEMFIDCFYLKPHVGD